MKKIFGALLVTCTIAIFSFQNCQQKQSNISTTDNSNSLGLVAVDKIQLNNKNISQINFNIQEVESILKSGRSFELQVNKSLQVNLLSGELNVVSDLAVDPEKYCLTADLLTQLKLILQNSQVCKFQSTGGISGEVCAEVIVPAYADVVTDSEQFALGYAVNACRNNMVDLCDDQATVLRGYLAHLKDTYKNLNCSN